MILLGGARSVLYDEKDFAEAGKRFIPRLRVIHQWHLANLVHCKCLRCERGVV